MKHHLGGVSYSLNKITFSCEYTAISNYINGNNCRMRRWRLYEMCISKHKSNTQASLSNCMRFTATFCCCMFRDGLQAINRT